MERRQALETLPIVKLLKIPHIPPDTFFPGIQVSSSHES
jgi:hypothetical protein